MGSLRNKQTHKESFRIITTMFAMIPVIEYAISTGANFSIAHEPTYYNYLDETEWFENDSTYQYKSRDC